MEVVMTRKGLLISVLAVSVFNLSACHDGSRDHRTYDTDYIASGEYKVVNFQFVPGLSYRVDLVTYSGDADIAIYNDYNEQVVYSQEYGTDTDSVIFTADDHTYDIEIYGNYSSEYQLYIEQLPYDYNGLVTDTDGMEFNIDANTFTGELYTILASRSIQVSQAFDTLTITPLPDAPWLNVTPSGTLYDNSATVWIDILETQFPSTNNYAAVRLRATDLDGKVSLFKDIDIYYHVTGLN